MSIAESPRPAEDSAASAPRSGRRYCLVAPARDEARFARRTLEAIVRQTELPALVVVVDDGSADETPKIIEEYVARYPYIRILRRPNRGHRNVGAGVVEAFYSGLATVNLDEFDYVCKADLDLDFAPWYFASVMDRMEKEPRLGTFSGKPYFFTHGEDLPARFPLEHDPRLVSEKSGDENAVGMLKFYRTACFRQIGGFVQQVMWDGIDGHRCRQHGWIARSEDDPRLRVAHLRPMGKSHKSWWTGRMRHGFGQYFMGTTPAYMLASAVYRMSRPPLVVGGIGMIAGYLKSMILRAPRYEDPEFRKFLRRYQWRCLFTGKARATARLNRLQEPRWDPDAPPAGRA